MRHQVTNSALIGLSAAFLWHFSNIARYGSHTIQEPVASILIAEIVFMSCVLIWGIWNFIVDIKEKN